jgi:hypothetical protein
MTFDWFLLLTPILLLPILLLLSFTGCGPGTIGEPSVTFILHDNLLLVPAPVVTKVDFQWIIGAGGPFRENAQYVEEPTPIKDDSGNTVALEFRYQAEIRDFEFDQRWTVTCVPFGGENRLGAVSCGPFELTSPPPLVEFEIVSDTSGVVTVQVSAGGCPSPTTLL